MKNANGHEDLMVAATGNWGFISLSFSNAYKIQNILLTLINGTEAHIGTGQ